MNLKKLFGAGLVAVMSLSFATGAFADDSDVTKSDTVDATLNSGGFDLTTSPIDSFGNITIKIDDEKYSTSFERDFVVKDLRGLDDNWQLTVSSTALESETHSFDNVLSISPLADIEREGTTNYNDLPDKGISSETVLDDGDVLIAKSDDGSGLGQFSLTFPDDAIHLMVTPGMKEGLFESTLTWNLMSVPSN